MTEDLQTDLIGEFFSGGWRIAPFIRTPDGYVGVKAWPKRAAKNSVELQTLIEEQAAKSRKQPIFGVVPPLGRYVVDIDTKNNPGALDLWKSKVHEAFGSYELAVPNLVVKTKSAGFHLYYSNGSDQQIHSPTAVFGRDSGVDIRGYTGMVVAPTSYGTTEDWVPGEYTVVKGRPTDPPTVLPLAKILGDSFDEVDHFVRGMLSIVNGCLRNDSIGELYRHKLLPDSLVIPSSSRDNTLYRCARLCRLADLSQDAAVLFMGALAARCETTPEEPLEHWILLATDKVRRVYGSDQEMKLRSVSALYEELDNSGTVLLRDTNKSYYYFRYGSKVLRLEPRSMYSTDNIGNVMQGLSVTTDEDTIPVRKIIPSYAPKDVACNASMYPRKNMPYFEFEGRRFVNTYHDPFATFEPNKAMFDRAAPFVERFSELVRHITGYEDGDDARLLDKLAWIVQRPYRKLPTGTIIYSHVRGSGKDVFMSIARELVGRQYYMPISLSAVESRHATFHEKILCVASEVQLQTNARGNIAAASFMGKIKDLITAKNVTVEPKFQQPFTAPTFSNFVVLSNFELSSLLEPGDRRWDVFHATEEKLDQSRFGDLADLGNDGIWLDKPAEDQYLRAHVIYAIRQALMDRSIDPYFDREEASMNEVKTALLEHQNPPTMDWMFNNLPAHFTEEVVQIACMFCPTKAHPEYVMKQLREHFGPRLQTLNRTGRLVYRMNAAPRLEIRSEGSITVPVLNFDVKASDIARRQLVYTFGRTPRDATPSDAAIRNDIVNWYHAMKSKFYGNPVNLPNQKPDAGPGTI